MFFFMRENHSFLLCMLFFMLENNRFPTLLDLFYARKNSPFPTFHASFFLYQKTLTQGSQMDFWDCRNLWPNCRKSWEIWGENCRSFYKTCRELTQIAGISYNYMRSGNTALTLSYLTCQYFLHQKTNHILLYMLIFFCIKKLTISYFTC
jgi:hypothetical protein